MANRATPLWCLTRAALALSSAALPLTTPYPPSNETHPNPRIGTHLGLTHCEPHSPLPYPSGTETPIPRSETPIPRNDLAEGAHSDQAQRSAWRSGGQVSSFLGCCVPMPAMSSPFSPSADPRGTGTGTGTGTRGNPAGSGSPGAEMPGQPSNQHTARWRVFTDQGREMFSQGRMKEAERYFVKALEESKLGFGSTDPHVASSCNNLAELYRVLGRYSEAEPLYLSASQLLKDAADATAISTLQAGGTPASGTSQGYEDPEVAAAAAGMPVGHAGLTAGAAFALHNLGGLYLRQGDLDRAFECYREALQIKQRTLGEAHPEYANTLFHLAEVHRLQGKHSEAAALLSQSIRILEDSEGGDVQRIARRALRLTQILTQSEAWEEAELLQRRVLHLVQSSAQMGPQSPAAAALSEGIATCLMHRCREQLKNVSAGSGDNRESPLVQDSTHSVDALGKDEGILEKGILEKGILEEAQELLQRCLRVKQESLGKNHLSVASTLLRLADLLILRVEFENSRALVAVGSMLHQEGRNTTDKMHDQEGRKTKAEGIIDSKHSSISLSNSSSSQQSSTSDKSSHHPQGADITALSKLTQSQVQQMLEDAHIAAQKAQSISEAEWGLAARDMAMMRRTLQGHSEENDSPQIAQGEALDKGSRQRRRERQVSAAAGSALLCLVRSLEIQAKILLNFPSLLQYEEEHATTQAMQMLQRIAYFGKQEEELLAGSKELEALVERCTELLRSTSSL